MQLAILIQAHKNPAQVARLLNALQQPYIDCYVNVDKKVAITPFMQQVAALERIYFIKNRTKVHWGDISQVKATVHGLKEIRNSGRVYDYVLYISGQDYPIKPLDQLHDFLVQQTGKLFLEWSPISPTDRPWAMKRYQRVHVPEHLLEFLRSYTLRKQLKDLLDRIPDRKFPLGMSPFHGSTWWCLTQECVNYLVQFYEEHKSFVRFHRLTQCADEIFIPSIIMNSRFAADVVCSNLNYIDWSENKPNPKILNQHDYEALAASQNFFARKFDMTHDAAILDKLDQLLTQPQVTLSESKIK